MTEIDLQTVQDIATKYPDMEKLFMQLPGDLRLHGIRVAEYSLALYNAAVEAEMNLADKKSEEERSPKFSDFVYKVGRYHDIGIMCLPEDHPLRQESVTALDLENDASHTLLGYALAQCYEQEAKGEPEMFWRFMKEAIKMHHEKPDGTGFPDGLVMNQMSLVSWLVSVAVILDIYAAYTRSEYPFKEAYERVMGYAVAEELFETEVVLRVCRTKLEKVFEKHVKETRIIVFDSLMVNHTSRSPMFLKYRKVNSLEGRTTAVQTLPVFFSRTQRESMYYEEIRAKLKEAKLTQQVFEFFLYEASDMRMKMDAYGLTNCMLQVPLLSGTFTNSKISTFFDKWIADTGTNPEQYCFMVEADTMYAPSQTLIKNLNQIKSYGAKLMLVDFTGNEPYKGEDLGVSFDAVQTSPVILDRMDEELEDLLREIWETGIELQADGIDTDDYDELLNNLKFSAICGDYAGDYSFGSDILRDCIDK